MQAGELSEPERTAHMAAELARTRQTIEFLRFRISQLEGALIPFARAQSDYERSNVPDVHFDLAANLLGVF